jgi:HAD superfamily hydrolase (TIGR01509 family)
VTSSRYRAVLFDFSGTLFRVEDARTAVRAALGEPFLHLAPALQRWGAINGSDTPDGLPTSLADVWARRDLTPEAHRAAYSGLAVHAGLTRPQADLVYERGVSPAAWRPYPDTGAVLRRLHAAGVPVAVVSNIGWDPRPVLREYGVAEYLPDLVLSDELGVMKPDPEIFRTACARLGVPPQQTVMIGDNPVADGGAAAIGCRFVLVPSAADRPEDTLLRAVEPVLSADRGGSA